MLGAFLVLAVTAQKPGLSALGPNPAVFESKLHGIRMCYPRAWTVMIDDTKRPKDAEMAEFYKDIVFEAGDGASSDIAFRVYRDTENPRLPEPSLWGDPTKLHTLPEDFRFDKSRYYVTIGNRPIYVGFSKMLEQTSFDKWFYTITAWFMGPRESFQLSLELMDLRDSGNDAVAAAKLKPYYPVFKAMLQTISFPKEQEPPIPH